jgi:hypothetical protein
MRDVAAVRPERHGDRLRGRAEEAHFQQLLTGRHRPPRPGGHHRGRDKGRVPDRIRQPGLRATLRAHSAEAAPQESAGPLRAGDRGHSAGAAARSHVQEPIREAGHHLLQAREASLPESDRAAQLRPLLGCGALSVCQGGRPRATVGMCTPRCPICFYGLSDKFVLLLVDVV